MQGLGFILSRIVFLCIAISQIHFDLCIYKMSGFFLGDVVDLIAWRFNL